MLKEVDKRAATCNQLFLPDIQFTCLIYLSFVILTFDISVCLLFVL